MNEFELPSNIKQIGSIGDGPRIYMEDYVCTYLKQFAESGGHCEKVAFLIGKHLVIDSQSVLFINGAVQGKYSEYENGIENFTQKSFSYAEEQIESYFKGFEIIGWMQSQPGYSVFLNPAYSKYHMTHFRKPYHMLFVIDPVEKLNAFYVWNAEMTALAEAKGYFVYYDKNPGMQAYMIDNKLIKLDMKEKKANTEMLRDREIIDNKLNKNTYEHGQKKYYIGKPAVSRRAQTSSDNKRLVNMLVSLSAVLFIICFIMGAGLIQNDDRINQLETNLDTLNNTYAYIVNQLKQASTQPVFALQGEDEAKNQQKASNEQADTAQPVQEDDTSAEAASTPTPEPTPETTEEPAGEQTQAPTPEPVEIVPAAVINVEPQINEIPDTYVVQKGDNLSQISEKFYGTRDMAAKIMEANGLTDPDKIFFGKILLLPKQ